MFQQGSYLKVIDNSAAKDIACIRVYKNGRRPLGQTGDRILASVKSLRRVRSQILRSKKHLQSRGKAKELKKGDMVQALIVRTRRKVDRSKGLGRKAKKQTGILYSFPKENAALLLAANGQDPLATRLRGPLSPVARTKRYAKILSLGGSLT